MFGTNKGVAFIRNEIAKKRKEWQLIKDCLQGELEIKRKGFKYLPYPSTLDDCRNENDPRYLAYKDRAVFLNVTRRTIYELLAQVFIKSPIVQISDTNSIIGLLKENATGNGISLEQCAKQSLRYALAYAYGGVFVDFPEKDKPISLAEFNTGNYRPTITPYSPFTIRNFRVEDVGVEERLVLVVLQESFWEYDDDGFETKECEQLRVLKLVNGYYEQHIYRSSAYDQNGKANGNWDKKRVIKPTDLDGNRLTEIPFYFIGLENNNPYPDNPIMYDLASLNISHYRNSADYEETMFIAGQATLLLSGLDTDNKNSSTRQIKLGSNSAIVLKNGGTGSLLQAKADSGLAESMEKKEKAMAKFGAKFLETDNVAKTAYQVKVENPSQGSILGNCADNVSNAYTKALKMAHKVCGIGEENVKFELNTDFEYNRVGSDEQNFHINAWVADAITFEEMRACLRRAGTAIEDDSEAKAKIEKAQAEKQKQQIKLAQATKPTNDDNNQQKGKQE